MGRAVCVCVLPFYSFPLQKNQPLRALLVRVRASIWKTSDLPALFCRSPLSAKMAIMPSSVGPIQGTQVS